MSSSAGAGGDAGSSRAWPGGSSSVFRQRVLRGQRQRGRRRRRSPSCAARRSPCSCDEALELTRLVDADLLLASRPRAGRRDRRPDGTQVGMAARHDLTATRAGAARRADRCRCRRSRAPSRCATSAFPTPGGPGKQQRVRQAIRRRARVDEPCAHVRPMSVDQRRPGSWLLHARARIAASTAAWTGARATACASIDPPGRSGSARGERVEAGAGRARGTPTSSAWKRSFSPRARCRPTRTGQSRRQRPMRRDAAARPGVGAGHELEIEAATISLVGDRRRRRSDRLSTDRACRDRGRDEPARCAGRGRRDRGRARRGHGNGLTGVEEELSQGRGRARCRGLGRGSDPPAVGTQHRREALTCVDLPAPSGPSRRSDTPSRRTWCCLHTARARGSSRFRRVRSLTPLDGGGLGRDRGRARCRRGAVSRCTAW